MKRPQACVERLLGIYKHRIPFLPRPSRFWWLGADDCKYFLLYLFRIYLIFKVPPLATQDSARYLRDYESYQLRTSYSTWPYGRQHLHRWRWQFQVMLLSSRLLKPAFCVDSDSELRGTQYEKYKFRLVVIILVSKSMHIEVDDHREPINSRFSVGSESALISAEQERWRGWAEAKQTNHFPPPLLNSGRKWLITSRSGESSLVPTQFRLEHWRDALASQQYMWLR